MHQSANELLSVVSASSAAVAKSGRRTAPEVNELNLCNHIDVIWWYIVDEGERLAIDPFKGSSSSGPQFVRSSALRSVSTTRSQITLGADPYLPGRHIVSFLRVFKQFACNIPGG